MGGLLDRIRGKKYDNYKKKRNEAKIKRSQIRLNRFDDEEERYKTVKPKDGGGYRYIEVNPSVQVSFREIKKRALNLYFDQDGCSVFQENEFDCICIICNEAGIHSLASMKIMIFGITLKVKVYSFLRQCLC